jgi:hypothetical protein
VVKVLCVFATRPEASKLAPVIRALRRNPNRVACKVCLGRLRKVEEDTEGRNPCQGERERRKYGEEHESSSAGTIDS